MGHLNLIYFYLPEFQLSSGPDEPIFAFPGTLIHATSNKLVQVTMTFSLAGWRKIVMRKHSLLPITKQVVKDWVGFL